MLNKIWLSFILSAFLYACFQAVFVSDGLIFEQMMQSVFSMAKLTVELAIGLIGLMAFWLGVSRVAEKNGMLSRVSYMLSPVFNKIMPDVPRNHPAFGHITMNMAANVMGLDNAATPLGLKAMLSLQSLNPKPDTATNAQIMFLVLNTSSITLFPITVFMYRAQQGAEQPTDVFLPILLATMASTLAGFIAVCIAQKIDLLRAKTFLVMSLVIGACVAGVTWLITLSVAQLNHVSSVSANFLILLFIVAVLLVGYLKNLDVYDEFIEGAKEGAGIAFGIIPFLLAMLVAIGLLRSSGLLDGVLFIVSQLVLLCNGDIRFVDALPVALLKPLSGSGARGMMIETMQNYGVDSFAGRLSAILQGSTETTFYVLAVYFGSVGIKYIRHALTCGLIADLAGIMAAITVTYIFYG